MNYDHARYKNSLLETLVYPTSNDLDDQIIQELFDHLENNYLEESFSIKGIIDKIKSLKDPRKMFGKIKQKYSSMAKGIINQHKAGRILKSAMSDISSLRNKIKKIDPNISLSAKKTAIMKVTKEFVRNKFDNKISEGFVLNEEEKEKGSKAAIVFNAILFLIFLYIGIQEVTFGADPAQIVLSGVLIVWCLFDIIHNMILLSKEK